jgi:hypothetical protein
MFGSDHLPPAFHATVAATIFALAGVWFVGCGVDQQVLGYQGAGFYLSAGVIALLATALAGWQFVRRVATSP